MLSEKDLLGRVDLSVSPGELSNAVSFSLLMLCDYHDASMIEGTWPACVLHSWLLTAGVPVGADVIFPAQAG